MELNMKRGRKKKNDTRALADVIIAVRTFTDRSVMFTYLTAPALLADLTMMLRTFTVRYQRNYNTNA